MKALFRHWPAGAPLAHHPLARKLAIVTAIKLVVLMALWWAFFSGHGQRGDQEAMTPEQAAAAILHSRVTPGFTDPNRNINATQ